MDSVIEIKEILKQLAEKNTPYIILREYDFLFDTSITVPRDIDILVPDVAMDSIKDVLSKHGYVSSFTLGHHDFGKIRSGDAPALDIQQESVREKNLAYMNFDLAKKYEQRLEGIPLLAGAGLAFHLVIHSIIGKGYFKNGYRVKLRSLIREVSLGKELKNLLGNCFGESESSNMINSLTKGDFSKLEDRKWEYTARFWVRNPTCSLDFMNYSTHRLKRKINMRRLFGPGCVISFIGLDGAGKTTLARSFMERLRENGYRTQYIYMGRVKGHTLPMHAISRKVGVSKLEKKGTPPRVYFLARELAYFADLLARYLFLIVPRILSGTVIVCDRYAYDLILDKHCSALTRFLLKYIYPRPRLLLFLDLPVEKIIERRDEYDSETRNNYLKKLRQIEEMFNAIKIIPDDVKENTEAVYQLYIRGIR